MANRNDSDARQHETLPGFGANPGVGPGLHQGTNGAAGARPVEQMVDAAIERIEREQRPSQEHALAAPGLVRANLDQVVPTRLRWKGLDVSDEFREYAKRVSSGEDLPPFEGHVLAEPNPAFPWGAPPAEEEAAPRKSSGSKVALWSSAIVALALIGWSLMPRGETADGSASIEPATLARAGELPSPMAPAPIDLEKADALQTDALKTDGVATEALEAPIEVASAALLPARSDSSTASASAVPLGVHSSVAPPGTEVSNGEPSDPAPATARPAPPAPASWAARGASRNVVSAVPAAPVASAPPPAPVQSVPADEFGIMPVDDPATSTPGTVTPGAVTPGAGTPGAGTPGAGTPGAAAKNVAPTGSSVGDLSRAGQGSAGAVRKEPGRESSAKGSLLVETPSF